MKSTTTLKKYLQSIKDENVEKVIHYSQYHHKNNAMRERLKMLIENKFIKSFEVLNEIYTFDGVIADVKCKINDMGYQFRLVKEIGIDKPSKKGQWKVNLASMRKVQPNSTL